MFTDMRHAWRALYATPAFTSVAVATLAVGIAVNTIAFQRTREIGIRVALGARSQDVFGLMLGAGAKLIAIGIAAGLVGAFSTTRFLKVRLAAVDPLDPLAFAAASGFLAVIALIASYVPARRALRVDPVAAMREA